MIRRPANLIRLSHLNNISKQGGMSVVGKIPRPNNAALHRPTLHK